MSKENSEEIDQQMKEAMNYLQKYLETGEHIHLVMMEGAWPLSLQESGHTMSKIVNQERPTSDEPTERVSEDSPWGKMAKDIIEDN